VAIAYKFCNIRVLGESGVGVTIGRTVQLEFSLLTNPHPPVKSISYTLTDRIIDVKDHVGYTTDYTIYY
jgi:hypothetical protein